MTADMAKQIHELEDMTVGELKRRWAEVFGEEAPNGHRRYLVKRLAWRIQANAEGDICERARRRAEELANDADLRVRPPRAMPVGEGGTISQVMSPHDTRLPMPGTVLTRQYKGGTVRVTVLERGFEYAGEVYRSLTAVARAITGCHWNGYHFFGLRKGR
ncbi:MAG: DUF2924 domain-containing protein [Planctomycetes bacterium]|nr:DUF2924 domain-containing protein [Planctomycetota bacterium]